MLLSLRLNDGEKAIKRRAPEPHRVQAREGKPTVDLLILFTSIEAFASKSHLPAGAEMPAASGEEFFMTKEQKEAHQQAKMKEQLKKQVMHGQGFCMNCST